MDTLSADYIVGFVDGEGCFCIVNRRNGTKRPRFSVSNTDLRILQRIRKIFGNIGYIRTKKTPKKFPNAKICYAFCANALDDLLFLKSFFDKHLLIVKKEQYKKWSESVMAFDATARWRWKKVTEEEEKQIIKAYVNGITWREFPKQFGRSQSTLMRILARHPEVPRRGIENTQYKKGNYPKRWLKEKS